MEFIRRTYYEKTRANKTKIFRVRNNRVQFKCTHCGAKRSISVPPNLLRKSIKCHKCQKITKCILNKRICNREPHCGKLYLTMFGGKELEVHLVDISETGIGVDIPIGATRSRMLKLGDLVSFRCTWNRHLLGANRYVVRNIKERHIGVEKIR